MLLNKAQDEAKALALCRSKALQRGLKMDITSAEWQWDRRKLTFFFIADKRIDFRDLVKDLFRTWKTRIWCGAGAVWFRIIFEFEADEAAVEFCSRIARL